MTQDELDLMAKTFALVSHNFQQNKIFKTGCIALPQFETYEDMEKFFEIMRESFPMAKRRFKDFKESESDEIIFRIPEKYK